MEPLALKMSAVTKAFHQNVVLRGVDFTLRQGEIRALLGETARASPR